MSSAKIEQGVLKDKFCKHYANIRLNCDASFQDRMQFDIYKRATKLDRYEVFLESQKAKMPKEELDKVFDRVTKKREVCKPKDCNVQQQEPEKKEKKITQVQSEAMYSNFMERYKKGQEKIEEKRRLKKLAEQQEEEKIRAMQNRKKSNKGGADLNVSFALVERMNADVEKRKLRQEQRKKEKEEKSKEETEGMFVPKTNQSFSKGGSQVRSKSRLDISSIHSQKIDIAETPKTCGMNNKIAKCRPSIRSSEQTEKETERIDKSNIICGNSTLRLIKHIVKDILKNDVYSNIEPIEEGESRRTLKENVQINKQTWKQNGYVIPSKANAIVGKLFFNNGNC